MDVHIYLVVQSKPVCYRLMFPHDTDYLKESGHLSQAQISLDRAQDEIQLMKLSLSEKETQLLQSQDQLL